MIAQLSSFCALGYLTTCLLLLFTPGCSVYLGTQPVSKTRYEREVEHQIVHQWKEGEESSSSETVYYRLCYLDYNWWTDATLAKLWLFAPSYTLYSIYDSVINGRLESWEKNPIGDMFDRLLGGGGAYSSLYLENREGYQVGYFSRVMDWLNWFNPFRAHFVGLEEIKYSYQSRLQPDRGCKKEGID
mgnify:CR=1 FL=1